jgi:hypothetical protein
MRGKGAQRGTQARVAWERMPFKRRIGLEDFVTRPLPAAGLSSRGAAAMSRHGHTSSQI